MSIARYSFVHLSELGHQGENEEEEECLFGKINVHYA